VTGLRRMAGRLTATAGLRRVAGRLVTTAALLLLLSALIYVAVDLLPGDPVTSRLGPAASPERVAEARARLGLDRPLWERYAGWLGDLLRGRLGESATGVPVAALLSDRVANSAQLAALTMAVLVPLSLLLGLLAGTRRGAGVDRAVTAGALLLVAVPEFVLAGLFVLVFAVTLDWVPAVSLIPAGSGPLAHPRSLVLPVASLLLLGLAYATRIIRSATAAALRAPHVEFARLNGLPPRRILRHAVLPAVLPVAVQVWLVVGAGLVGGAVLVERVFGYPGVGELMVSAVVTGDMPVVQAVAMILGATMLVALSVADLGLRLLGPAGAP
jgi:peptide/nickel transport system permease protein